MKRSLHPRDHPELLSKYWRQAKKAAMSDRQFRIRMVDECGGNSLPSRVSTKSDAHTSLHVKRALLPATYLKVTKHHSGGDVTLTFSSQFDPTVRSYQAYILRGSDKWLIGETNDVLASSFVVEADRIEQFRTVINKHHKHASVYHVSVVTTDEFGKSVTSKHLSVQKSDIFGDTAIPAKETQQEIDSDKSAAKAAEKKASIEKKLVEVIAG